MSRVASLVCAISAALLILIITQNPSVEGYNVRFRSPYGPYSRYKAIRPLPCRGTNKAYSGSPGVCMFSFDCMQQRGTPIGTCMDSIYVGSCCRLVHDPPVSVTNSTTAPISTSSPPLSSQGSPAPANVPVALVVSDAAGSLRPRPVATSAAPSTAAPSTAAPSTAAASSAAATSSPVTTESAPTTNTGRTTQHISSTRTTTTQVPLITTISDGAKVAAATVSTRKPLPETSSPSNWASSEATTASSAPPAPTTTRAALPDETDVSEATSPKVAIVEATSPSWEIIAIVNLTASTEVGGGKNSSPPQILDKVILTTAAPLASNGSVTESANSTSADSTLINVGIHFPDETGSPSSSTAPSTTSATTAATTTTTTPAPTTTASTTTTTPGPTKPPGLEDICGRRSVSPKGRIVGGTQSTFSEWPWMVSLRQWKKNAFLHKCGAALLNNYWAITAAHCVENVAPNDLLLRLGEFDVSHEKEALPYVERRVQIIAPHPEFDPRTFEYDLALLRFYEPVHFRKNMVPICLPSGNETYIGKRATVTGWGRLYEDGPLPDTLQHVDVPVINNRDCETMYRRAGYIEEIPNIFICAGLSKGGKDSCEGDSGGPLVIEKQDRWELIGIISWGIGCALPNQPGVYTRISEFATWINQIVAF